jgi:hypothetical protein
MPCVRRTSTPDAFDPLKPIEVFPVSKQTAVSIKTQVIRIYGGGVAVFVATFGLISATVLFFAYLK